MERDRGRGGLRYGVGLGEGELYVRNPIPLKIRRVVGLLHAKLYAGVKRSPVGVLQKFEEGVPSQVTSSSSDIG
ncbi:hypothetical protein AVEN_31401-1 [Araneus ventricosus]|uniref:Uncharacterized protein n=1 Tax=Araneus ventricosus TaxID=182803 RepID=A0A4Y2F5U5_ARAVE|nr:hypothetical protein AVEN_31401-1 [Araneus ventricosus]